MIRLSSLLLLCNLICLLSFDSHAQCHEYRYNTSPHSGWVSCEASESPNSQRGESIWLEYDLGKNQTLQSSWIWNHNSINTLIYGMTSFVVDYKEEFASTWTELGTYSMDLADGSAFYNGVEGPDFKGLTARYILITILQNGGGECRGFGEWKIQTAQPISSTSQISDQNWFQVYPNPAIDEITIQLQGEYGLTNIEILDQLGRSTMSQTMLVGELKTVDVSSLAAGMYTVCLESGTSKSCEKISVVRN